MTPEEAIEYIRWLKTPILPAPTNPLKEACDMAIEALEKQIPKKPYRKVWTYTTEWICPCCSKSAEVVFHADLYGYGKIKMNFCWNCGQRIDWSDEE